MRSDGEFARIWFFASGSAVKPVKSDSGVIRPAIIETFHLMTGERIKEYQWAEIAPGGSIDGWFKPKDVHVDTEIEKITGVVLLPHLADPTPVDATLAALLTHAKVQAGDTPFLVIKKLCDYHHKTPGEFAHPGLRPRLY